MRQLDALFLSVARDERGCPTSLYVRFKPVSARQLHEYRCFLLGIREPETVKRLWLEERDRLEGTPMKGTDRDA